MSKESIKEIDSRLKMAEDAEREQLMKVYAPDDRAVEMVEPGKATGRVGNLMQKAEGKAACRKRAPCENASVRRKIC